MIPRDDPIWSIPMAAICGATWVYRVWANALAGFDCTVWVVWPLPEPRLRDPGPILPGTTVEFTQPFGR